MKNKDQVFINVAKTCAFTGHRTLEKDFDIKRLISCVKTAITNGYDTFLVGMAIGFDSVCFNVLDGLKNENGIKIIACVPCLEQSKNFTKAQKSTYDDMLKKADEVILLQQEYTKNCMLKRNEFLVDNSSLLIAYLRNDKTGTSFTVNYANKKGVKVEYV